VVVVFTVLIGAFSQVPLRIWLPVGINVVVFSVMALSYVWLTAWLLSIAWLGSQPAAPHVLLLGAYLLVVVERPYSHVHGLSLRELAQLR
jgi:hypothetical protein